jgi:hypothetical protein
MFFSAKGGPFGDVADDEDHAMFLIGSNGRRTFFKICLQHKALAILLFSICKPSYCCPKAKFETINTMSVNLFFIIGGNGFALGVRADFNPLSQSRRLIDLIYIFFSFEEIFQPDAKRVL